VNSRGDTLTPAAVSNWERNKFVPELDHLIAAAKLMGASIDDLVGIGAWGVRESDERYQKESEYQKVIARLEGLTPEAKRTVLRLIELLHQKT